MDFQFKDLMFKMTIKKIVGITILFNDGTIKYYHGKLDILNFTKEIEKEIEHLKTEP